MEQTIFVSTSASAKSSTLQLQSGASDCQRSIIPGKSSPVETLGAAPPAKAGGQKDRGLVVVCPVQEGDGLGPVAVDGGTEGGGRQTGGDAVLHGPQHGHEV